MKLSRASGTLVRTVKNCSAPVASKTISRARSGLLVFKFLPFRGNGVVGCRLITQLRDRVGRSNYIVAVSASDFEWRR